MMRIQGIIAGILIVLFAIIAFPLTAITLLLIRTHDLLRFLQEKAYKWGADCDCKDRDDQGEE